MCKIFRSAFSISILFTFYLERSDKINNYSEHRCWSQNLVPSLTSYVTLVGLHVYSGLFQDSMKNTIKATDTEMEPIGSGRAKWQNLTRELEQSTVSGYLWPQARKVNLPIVSHLQNKVDISSTSFKGFLGGLNAIKNIKCLAHSWHTKRLTDVSCFFPLVLKRLCRQRGRMKNEVGDHPGTSGMCTG